MKSEKDSGGESPENKIKIQTPDGRLVDAVEVDFTSKSEPWTIYDLADGTTLRVRLVITKVLRVEDFNPQTGEPAYNIQASQPIVSVQIPMKLRKQPSLKKPENREIT